jgi:hypothetical protein
MFLGGPYHFNLSAWSRAVDLVQEFVRPGTQLDWGFCFAACERGVSSAPDWGSHDLDIQVRTPNLGRIKRIKMK